MFTKWVGTQNGGTWLEAGHWSDGAPRVHQVAQIAGGRFGTISLQPIGRDQPRAGRLVINHAHVAFAGGTLTLQPDGSPPDQQVELSLAHSVVTIQAGAAISGSGSLAILDGVALSIGGALSDAIANVVGAGDSIAIDGPSARWTSSERLYLGSSGAPTSVSITNGGLLSAQLATLGNAQVSVIGSLSSINVGTLEVGNGTLGALTIAGGAHVETFEAVIGDAAVASVVVTGAGSRFDASGLGILVGDGVQQAILTVTDSASLGFASGLSVDGVLLLDGTAHVDSQDYISLEGGTIIAEPPPGQAVGPDVVLSNALDLFGFGSLRATGYVESLPGARLVLTGQIAETAISSERLQVAGGTVVLTNGSNDIAQLQIGPGMLELAATGAAGHHSIAFISGTGTLLIDAGVTVAEKILGFEISNQLIDFAGIAASSHGYSYTASGTGGTLTVQDGTHSVTLALSGYHDASDFFLGSDHAGGTTIYYEGPTHA